jgi:ATP-dependent Lon protease
VLLCRESGVRSLEKHIAKIARKIAFQAVGALETSQQQETETEAGHTEAEPKVAKEFEAVYDVTEDNLEEYLGKPKYPEVRMCGRPSGDG